VWRASYKKESNVQWAKKRQSGEEGKLRRFRNIETQGSFPRLGMKWGQAVVYSLISIATCTNGRNIKRVPYLQDWYFHIIDADF